MNANIEKARSMLEASTASISILGELFQTDEATWLTSLDHTFDAIISLEHDPTKLVITSEIGSLHHENRLRICEVMLSYNMLREQPGSARLSLGGGDGCVFLTFELSVAELTVTELHRAFSCFTDAARKWTEYLKFEDKGRNWPQPLEYFNPV